MKTILKYILAVIPLIAFGQRSNTIFSTGSNDFQNWTHSDFIKNEVSKVEGYSYLIKKNGKIKKKDSTMLFQQQIDLDSNKVFGIKCNLNYQSHGPAFYTWYKFGNYYNDKNLLIKYTSSPTEILKIKEYGSTTYNINTGEKTFEYDFNSNLTKEVYKRIEHYYSISKYTNDTFHLHTIYRPKIDEYNYNQNNQKSKWYQTTDSTRYLKTKTYDPTNDSDAVRCSYCHSRYLNVEWIYDSKSNLIEWISYTDKNLVHTKRNYSYDEKNRLIKQIDSTGWYFTTIEPYWESTTTYQYTDSIMIKTIINNTEAQFGSSTPKTVKTFDTNDRLISSCNYSDSTETCTNYSYRMANGHLTEIQMKFPNGRHRIEKFTFNDNGLLTEEHHFLEDKMVKLIKYYYEK